MANLLSAVGVVGILFVVHSAAHSSRARQKRFLPVHMSSPCDEPHTIQAWTRWFDRDNPDGEGDFESLDKLRGSYPGQICDSPGDIQAVTKAGDTPYNSGDRVFRFDKVSGFMCNNSQQQPGQICSDFKVRFSCPLEGCDRKVKWTLWYNTNITPGSDDWEDYRYIREADTRNVCDKPLYIQAVTAGDYIPAANTGQVFDFYSPKKGILCHNKNQKKNEACRDYMVRFGC